MSGESITVEFISKDAAMIRSFKNHIKEQNKTIKGYERMAAASKKAGKANKDGFNSSSKMVGMLQKQVLGTVASMGGLLSMAQLIRSEHQAMIQNQNSSRGTQLTAAQSMRDLRDNFSEDSTLSNADLESTVKRVSKRTGTKFQAVAGALSDAFSAKGNLTNKDAVEAVEQAFRFSPNNQTKGTTLAARALDISKFSGSTDMRANLGFLSNIQGAARVTSLEQAGKHLVPAINSIASQGDTPEQAAEIVATLTQLLGDAEGAQSKTASISLAERLSKFVPGAGGKDKNGSFRISNEQRAAFEGANSTTSRIALMQQNPELRRAFLSQNSFETASNAFIEQLLSGQKQAMEVMKQTQLQIKPINSRQSALFDEAIRKKEAGTFEATLKAKERSEANTEAFELTDTVPGRTANARNIYFNALKNAEAGTAYSYLAGISDFAERQFASKEVINNPEQYYAQRLRSELNFGDGGMMGSFSPEQRKIMEDQIRALEENADKCGQAIPSNAGNYQSDPRTNHRD